MYLKNKRVKGMDTCVYSFTGHYGSGKTEAAVNFAREAEAAGKKYCIDRS